MKILKNNVMTNSWIKAIIITGLLSPLFSPFFWIWIAILFDSSTEFSEFFVGIYFGILFAYTTAWSLIALTIFIFSLIIYFYYSYWITKNRWYWSMLGLIIATLSVSILLGLIGEYKGMEFILETYLSIMPAGALSALLFRRILIKNLK